MAARLGGEPIVAHFLPQGRVKYMAFSVRCGECSLVVGIGLGDGPTCSPVCQQVLDLVGAHLSSAGEVLLVLCRNKKTARQRVAQALLAAKDGMAIMIMCSDSTVYDAVLLPKLIGLEKG